MPPLNDDVMESSVRDDIVAAFKSNDDTPPADTTPPVDKTPAPTDKAPPADAPADKSVKAPAAADKAAPPAAALDAPARWPKEDKEEFSAFDPRVQALLLKRNKSMESDYTKKMMEIGAERKRFQGIESVLAQHRESWTRAGLDDTQALTRMMTAWSQAERDPMAFIRSFAQNRGIDLQSAFAPSPEQLAALINRAQGGAPGDTGSGRVPDPNYVPPAVARHLSETQRQVQTLSQQLQQRALQEQQVISQAASEELEQFINATDEHGQSLYPFFPELRGDMKVLMESGRAETLAEAYDMASRMNKTVFGRLQENAEIKRKREEEARRLQEAERARKAAASVSPSASAGVSDSSDDDGQELSLRAQLEKAFKGYHAQNRI